MGKSNSSVKFKSHLMVINYSMQRQNTIFSHQVDLVLELANQFEKVTVLTGEKPDFELPKNINVTIYSWRRGQDLRNAFRFFFKFLTVVRCKRDFILFSHMTESHSAIIALFVRISRIRHVLWYAHTSLNLRLRWCHFWVNTIITSTEGSCPIQSRKVIPVGQGIEVQDFLTKEVEIKNRKNLVTFGRFDPSKKIHLIIEAAKQLREIDSEIELTVIGNPSGPDESYKKLVLSRFSQDIAEGWLRFLPSVNRSDIPLVLRKYGIFVHSFEGSLDKTLVEATLLGIPVATVNTEYHKRYKSGDKTFSSLSSQIRSIQEMEESDLLSLILSAQRKAIQLDGFRAWSLRVSDILRDN